MSIISEALKKADRERRIARRLTPKRFEEEFELKAIKNGIKDITKRKKRWFVLSTLGIFLIVGIGILGFLSNKERLLQPIKHTSSMIPSSPLLPNAQDIRNSRSTISSTSNSLFELKLNGVIQGKGEPLAIINNKVLKKGDFIKGAELIDVESNKVTLLYRGKEITLHIE